MLDLGVCEADSGEGKMGVNSGRSRSSWKPLHELKPMRMRVLTASDLELPEEIRIFHLGAKHTYHQELERLKKGPHKRGTEGPFCFSGVTESLLLLLISLFRPSWLAQDQKGPFNIYLVSSPLPLRHLIESVFLGLRTHTHTHKEGGGREKEKLMDL